LEILTGFLNISLNLVVLFMIFWVQFKSVKAVKRKTFETIDDNGRTWILCLKFYTSIHSVVIYFTC